MKNKIGGGPLREIEPKPVRLNAFGNPFKMDKKNLAIDEVVLISFEVIPMIRLDKILQIAIPPLKKKVGRVKKEGHLGGRQDHWLSILWACGENDEKLVVSIRVFLLFLLFHLIIVLYSHPFP